MKQYLLFEDKYPPKFLVVISSKISKDIESVVNYNQNNAENVIKWSEYIDWVKGYLSNRAIAFDYTNRHSRLSNGTYFLNDFNCGIGYTIKENKFTKQPYVYIFMLNLKLDEFGLKSPYITENNNIKTQYNMKQVIRLTEGDLHRIINECVNEALNEIGDTERGQYALGSVCARNHKKYRDCYNNYDPNASKYYKTMNDASDIAHNSRLAADGDIEQARRMVNAYAKGSRNYMSSMNGSGNGDYRNMKIKH
jgi:hypothetical protein